MGNTIWFKLARASLLATCIISTIVTIWWLIIPFEMSYGDIFWNKEVGLRFNLWPHVLYVFVTFDVLYHDLYGGSFGYITPAFLGLHRYPISLIIFICTIASILLLRVSFKNKNAWRISISLSLVGWFLSYTFIIRVFLLSHTSLIGFVFDYLTATGFAISLFYFLKFFTSYPEELDFEACTELAERIILPKKIRYAQLQSCIDYFESWNKKMHDFWSRIFPYLFYDLGKPQEGKFKGAFAFVETPTYLLLSIFLSILTFSLWHWSLLDSPAGKIEILNFPLNGWLFLFSFIVISILLTVTVSNAYIKLKTQYHYGNENSRYQIEWIYLSVFCFAVFSAFIYFIIILADVFYAIPDDLIGSFLLMVPMLGFIVFLLSLVMSMFYRGTIDPKLIIRKSTVYTLIAIIMTVVFVLVETTFSSQVIVKLGMPSQVGAFTAATISALIFLPIRNLVQDGANRFVDRMLPASALAEGKRYETVVAYADLGGYMLASEEDEDKALTIASLFHKEGDKAAKKYKGRVIKRIGDALLMEFPSVENAVFALQYFYKNYHRICNEQNIEHMPINTGVHIGMVVKARDGDIYGNTVNIASRLEGVAGPDEIVLSEAAKKKLQPESFSLEAIGEQHLKNVSEPVLCFKIA